ncbi:MAG: Wzz/FepE/Etk N-terminal domain-containing protein [bacterium]|nr:Wzz/FepE/Etk N-terminal domain-containing protein [bacterium]
MSLLDYGRILVRRGWIIVLLAAVAAGSAYLLSRGQTPVYRATQLVLISPSRNDLGITEATLRLMNSYVVYLKSQERAQQVIDALSLDMLAGELEGAVTIQASRDNLTVQIDVDLPEGQPVGQIANEWGNLLVRYQQNENQTRRQEDRVNALLPDGPDISLLRPRPSLNAAIGAVIGVILGAVIIFVLEFLESVVIRRRDDIERGLELPVLAAIPDGQK